MERYENESFSQFSLLLFNIILNIFYTKKMTCLFLEYNFSKKG